MSGSNVRVRFAPSPTGYLHVGGARTALFNWLFARHHGGQFFLRIEDTDLERSEERFIEQILDALRWLGLDWDGDVEFQTRRLPHHQAALKRLYESGAAYPCFETDEELKTMRVEIGKVVHGKGDKEELKQEAPVSKVQEKEKIEKTKGKVGKEKRIYRYSTEAPKVSPEEARERIARGDAHYFRFRVPEGETIIDDLVRGRVVIQNAEIDDFVLTRPNGLPTYNFACATDDADMDITHVIRGEDHILNTPRQIMIIRALGHTPPIYAHLPLILGPDKTRLSKRHGATSVQEYRDQGYLPDALVNFLILLGWALDDSTELFTREEMVAHFTIERVNPSAAVFNHEKLEWLNGVYIRERTPREELTKLIRAELQREGYDLALYDDAALQEIIGLAIERVKTLRDFPAVLDFFFVDPERYEPAAIKKIFQKEEAAVRLAEARDALDALPDWSIAGIEARLRALSEEKQVGLGKIAQPLRLALTGRTASPGIFEVVYFVGRERTRRRLDAAIAFIKAGCPTHP